MIHKKKSKKIIILSSLVLSILIYTMLISPKGEIQTNDEGYDFNTFTIFLNPTSFSSSGTFLKIFYTSRLLDDAKKYGSYLKDANKIKSYSNYKCATDPTSTKYIQPCYRYICDYNYLDYFPVSSKPSKYNGKWICAFIKYPVTNF